MRSKYRNITSQARTLTGKARAIAQKLESEHRLTTDILSVSTIIIVLVLIIMSL